MEVTEELDDELEDERDANGKPKDEFLPENFKELIRFLDVGGVNLASVGVAKCCAIEKKKVKIKLIIINIHHKVLGAKTL